MARRRKGGAVGALMTISYSLRYARRLAGTVEKHEQWLHQHRRALELYDLEDLYENISMLYEKIARNIDRQMDNLEAPVNVARKSEQIIDALVTIFVKLVDRFGVIAQRFGYRRYAGTKINLDLLERKKRVALGCVGKDTSWTKDPGFKEAAKKLTASA